MRGYWAHTVHALVLRRAAREKEHETFEANDADLGQGVVSLEGAIDEMKAGTHASLLNLGRNVRRTVAIADTLGMTTKRNKLMRDETDFAKDILDVVAIDRLLDDGLW